MSKNKAKQINAILQAYFDSTSLSSAILGSVDADGNTNWYAYGRQIWSNSNTKISKNHIHRLYSMTKPIASVAAMQLVEKDLIRLDEPLNELMPEMVSIPILDENGKLYHSEQPITLRQLLTHTAGFSYDHKSAKLQKFAQPKEWPYPGKPRIFEPGTDFRYGPGVDWAGKVVEKISGQNLEVYVRENITGPLEMNSTWFNVPQELQDSIASRGTRDSLHNMVEWDRIPNIQTSYPAGSGMFGSPKDYLKFLHCILNYGAYDGGWILKQETVEIMLTDNLPGNIKLTNAFLETDRFGIGWAIRMKPNNLNLPEGGVYWAGAANTYFALDPKSKTAIVYFSNFFPHLDKEAFGMYKLFEKEVFTKIQM
jgi:CubicO group peptidase (beta-lactamase class C family)